MQRRRHAGDRPDAGVAVARRVAVEPLEHEQAVEPARGDVADGRLRAGRLERRDDGRAERRLVGRGRERHAHRAVVAAEARDPSVHLVAVLPVAEDLAEQRRAQHRRDGVGVRVGVERRLGAVGRPDGPLDESSSVRAAWSL
ncbi:hypothetical protein [Halobaculum litoreum]|uniref:hypothetical protein n=1 Tax=Halobaculum litoreum TaxID=3031998 RepID=UPI0024C31307|nr:hypothetical protein [Halobaculum sp. DT92]